MPIESNTTKCYPLLTDHLPDCFRQKALEELNETPQTRTEELRKLEELLAADKVTSGIRFEEDFLYQFLRHSKFKASKAFQYVLKYINFRRNHSGMFQSIPDEHFDGNLARKCFSVLPYRCPEGCAIVLGNLGKWNPRELSLENFQREAMAVFLQPLRSPITQICGYKTIFDFRDTFKIMRYCTPQIVFLVYQASLNCIPGRYKEVHFINKSMALAIGWPIIKRLMSEKIRKRIFFHSKPEDLLKHFPHSIIPVQYGGSLTNYHDTELMKKINKDHGKCSEGGQPNYF